MIDIVASMIAPALGYEEKVRVSNLGITDTNGLPVSPSVGQHVRIVSDITNLMTENEAVFSRHPQVNFVEEIIISQVNSSTQFFFTKYGAVGAANTVHESTDAVFLPGKYVIWFVVKDDRYSDKLLAKPISITINLQSKNYSFPQSIMTVSTNHPIYHPDDMIAISGIVDTTIQGLPISIVVTSQDVKRDFGQVYADSSGRYVTTINPAFLKNGQDSIYTVVVTYGKQLQASTQFELSNITDSIFGIDDLYESTAHSSIPNWIKNNAKLWANGNLSDNDFLKGIQYLVANGIIKI